MRFDEFWEDTPETDGSPLPLLPEGTHTGEIKWSEVKPLAFKASDKNPKGLSLIVKVAVSGYEPFEVIIPVQMRGLVGAVCKAARVEVPVKGQEWEEKQLKGKTVSFEATHYVAKNEVTYVNVTKWIEGPKGVPPKKVPARTPAAKVAAVGQGGTEDDIPF